MARKRARCPHCERRTLRLYRGVWRCKTCRTLTWTMFERPRVGKPGQGDRCQNCERQSVHRIGRVNGADVFRCGTCGTTNVEPVDRAMVSYP